MSVLVILATRLSMLASLLFLIYLLIYACAHGSAQLWSAVLFEVVVFFALIIHQVYREQRQSRTIADTAAAEILQKMPTLNKVKTTLSVMTIIGTAIACLYMMMDLSALVCASCGNLRAAETIYLQIAPPPSPSVHPALSLELLAGALTDAHKFERAEPLEFEILAIRKALVGKRHEMIASMYSNLGDFYRRANRLSDAEQFYKKAIVLSKDLNLPQGYGSPLTKLGALLCQEGRYEAADSALTSALIVRSRIFGPRSMKAGETMYELAQLRKSQGRTAEYESLMQTAHATGFGALSPPTTASKISVGSLVVLALAIIFYSQKERLLVWYAKRLNQAS